MSAVHKAQHLRTVMLEFQRSSLTWLQPPSVQITEALSLESGEVTGVAKQLTKASPKLSVKEECLKSREHKVKNIYRLYKNVVVGWDANLKMCGWTEGSVLQHSKLSHARVWMCAGLQPGTSSHSESWVLPTPLTGKTTQVSYCINIK